MSLQASVLDKSEHLAYQHSVHQPWLPPTGELIEGLSPWSKNKNCQQAILSRHPFSALLTVKRDASRDVLLIFQAIQEGLMYSKIVLDLHTSG